LSEQLLRDSATDNIAIAANEIPLNIYLEFLVNLFSAKVMNNYKWTNILQRYFSEAVNNGRKSP
jgi:hypothetical protein